MIYAVLSCISILFLGVSWFLYRRNCELFLCLLIALYSEFFYLLPGLNGPDDYKILLLPIIVILFLEGLLTGKLAFGRYGWWVVSFLVISGLGIVVAWASGQGIATGIKAAKFFPLVLVYFLLAGRELDIRKFVRYFIIMALGVAALATLQNLLHGSINFFIGLPPDRLAMMQRELRITVGQYVIAAGAVAAFVTYRQSGRWMYLLASAALYGEVLLIQHTRGFIAAVFISLCVIQFFSSPLTPIRLSLYLFLAGTGLGLWLACADLDLAEMVLGKKTATRVSESRRSYEARLKGYDYYWQRILERPIAGSGVLNINWEGNNEKLLQKRGIHLSDIGVTHFVVQSGLIGFLWLLCGLLRMWREFFRFPDRRIISCYVVVATFAAPTLDMMLRYDSLFLFFLFIGLLAGIKPSETSIPVAQGA